MERYRVSELARLSGVGPRTIDYYTNQGLLEPVGRSEGGHRFYGSDAPQRVRAIKAWQASGLPLQQIRERLAAPNAAAEVLTHAEQVREELKRIEREVGELGEQVAGLPPSSDTRAAAERAMQASMLCALALAQKVASLLSDAHIPLA
ncbi:MAG TPA: MerR family transcriptional regulator [Pyrinomonadaceae bacterium]|jgi:DNA-binding transcriptional MerR regulator